jgi:hypothetical protein
LRVEDASGKTLYRTVGGSPLQLSIALPSVEPPRELTIRFAPTTTRGAIRGAIELYSPGAIAEYEAARQRERASHDPKPEPIRTHALTGPGSCLEAVLGDDAAGQAVNRFGQALEAAQPEEVAWARHWSKQLIERLNEDVDGKIPRRGFDSLWEDMLLDPAPKGVVGRELRAVLAALEELVRREERSPVANSATARRRTVLRAVGCLHGAELR